MLICGFLERPWNPFRFSLLTQPSFSGMVGGRHFAERGRSSNSFRPLSLATNARAFLFWLMGLCPMTSPLKMKVASSDSSISPAMRNIRAWQSIQGFMLPPYPCFGCFTTSRCRFVISTTLKGRFMDRAETMARSALKNGVSKKRARTSMSCALMSSAASMLSRPPEKTQIAFIIISIVRPVPEKPPALFARRSTLWEHQY